MKKRFLVLIVLITTFTLSSFSTKKFSTYYYFIYDGSGDHYDLSNYSAPLESEPSHEITGLEGLNWIRVLDIQGNGISYAEFYDAANGYDQDDDGDLSDEIEISGQLDLFDQ